MTKAKKKDDTLLFGEQEVTLPPKDEPPPVAAKARQPKPKNEVAVREAPAVPIDPFVSMIREVALNPSLDVTKLDALLKMQERILERNAKSAFDEAFVKMQGALPIIDRNGAIVVHKKNSQGQYTDEVAHSTPFARYDDIMHAVMPILAEHGFALRFRNSRDAEGRVVVIGCLVGHGHREETEFALPHDSTGSKNPVQAIGSSTSYGRRMAACSLLNIVTRGQDDDGKASGAPITTGEPLTAEELEQVITLAGAVECSAPRLIKHLNSKRPKDHPVLKELADLPRSRFGEAIEALRMLEAAIVKKDAK